MAHGISDPDLAQLTGVAATVKRYWNLSQKHSAYCIENMTNSACKLSTEHGEKQWIDYRFN